MPQALVRAEHAAIAGISALPFLSKCSHVNSLRIVPFLQWLLSSTVIIVQMTGKRQRR